MSYERSGKVVVPKWWLDKVLPVLDSTPHTQIAADASRHANRASPWGNDAISKFRSGKVRTIELTNGISAALGVPQPFFTALTERAAIEMALIARAHPEHQASPASDAASTSRKRKLDAYDARSEQEMQNAARPRAAGVHSSDAPKQGRGGGGSRRLDRGRS